MGNVGLYNTSYLQERCIRTVKPWNREGQTKSLLSGSEGGSCETTPYSRPYLLRSAADASSTAIDFSKGGVEDGVVDSPPSRGPVRTPACSPSPLKRAPLGGSNCFSPNPRTIEGPSRKLNLPLDEAPGHHLIEDVVTPSALPIAVIDAVAHVRRQNLPSEGIPIEPPRPRRTPIAYSKNPIASMSKPPLRGSKSLSICEATDSPRRSKRKLTGAERVSMCDLLAEGSGSYYRSRREDILRGLAKLKAEEAAKLSRSESDKC